MSLRKQKNETNRTRLRLASWLDRHKNGPSHYHATLHSMLQDAAEGLNIPVSDVAEALVATPHAIQVSAFVYEECVLKSWIGSDQRPIDDFIARQVRRERPIGRKYITQLARSTMRVWQIVDVHPGKWIAVQPLRNTPDQEDKVRHVYDELASQSLTTHDYLLGRVIPMPDGRIFAASLLPLTRAQAGSLLDATSSSLAHSGFVTWAMGALYMFSDVPDQSPRAGRASNSQPNTPDEKLVNQQAQDQASASTEHNAPHDHGQTASSKAEAVQPPDRGKLLDRIRKLFAMSQETEASPYEAEIALRRCQSLMLRYGITESDLHTSQFSTETFRASNRVPMHIRWLASAMRPLHSVLFVTGGGEGPEFRGFEIDVKVAMMTMEYLEDAIERSLARRRRAGNFPAGRSAAYDYRVAFAMEVSDRINTLVEERKAAEAAATVTGTSLTIRKMEIVNQECGKNLRRTSHQYWGARDGEAAEAGQADGAKVSLDPQVDAARAALLEN